MTSDDIGIIFPGQGSQSIGMLASLAADYSVITETFDEASEALAFDLWGLAQQGPEASLNKTENTQPVVLAAGVALFRVWGSQGGCMPSMMAGHSLGEYTALVAAESIDFADAIKLVSARGRFMQAAVPEGSGAMAAILGLDDGQVENVCSEASVRGGVVEAVNYNSPGQVVIAGDADAVNAAAELAKEAGAKRAILLPVSVPSHCSLMKSASEQLASALDTIAVKMPAMPVLHNVDVSAATSPEAIKQKLVQQLYQPVRWSKTIEKFSASGHGVLIECGPGKVLTGLNRKIDKTINSFPISDPKGLEKAMEAIQC